MEKVKLIEICNPKQWKTLATGELMTEGEYPVYGANGIIGYYDRYNHEKETVLITCRGATCGNIHISKEKSYINGNAMALDNLREDICLKKYLFYFLKQYDMKKIISGSAQPQITVQGLKKIEIKLYALNKQKAVIEELDKVQEIIDIREKQIEKLDELIKSQFVKIFGDPIINSKKLKVKKLGDICKIYRGASPRPINNYLNGTVPWIKIGDATKGDNIYLHNTKEKITEEGVKRSRLIKKGGLIFANCGVSLGFARIINFDGCIHDGWLAFENYEKVLSPIFFLQSLNFCTEHFRAIAPDGTQPNLNTDIMKNYMQIVPDMKQQLKFVEIVERIDEQKFEIQKSLDEMQKLQESLMNKYLG